MNTVNLELTTKQIILLFRGLDLLRGSVDTNNDEWKETCDLIRYVDKQTFRE